jgi:hypothetical protein
MKRTPGDWIILILVLIWAVLLVLLLATKVNLVYAAGDPDLAPVRTKAQIALHEAADYLRLAGFAEDSAPIRVLSEAWWAEQERLDILANVVEGEAGDCPWEHRVAVAAVVLNRVGDTRFPDTVRKVVGQTDIINGRTVHQYSPDYLYGSNARRSSYEAAAAALDGRHDVPADVVWQAQFPQGREVWWESYVDTGWYSSTTYFCR